MQIHPPLDTKNPSPNLRQEITEGLLYTHSRINTTTKKILETASFLYALVELLSEKGLIGIEELDERKRIVGERLIEQFRKNGNGIIFPDHEYDKYSFSDEVTVDCSHRVHLLCKAACCQLPFALSKQDIREGIVHWDLGQPYLIAHNGNGTCCHLDCDALICTVWEHRPVPCRGFDCRQDKRIWLDFEKMIINPDINKPDWPGCLAQGEGKAIDQ